MSSAAGDWGVPLPGALSVWFSEDVSAWSDAAVTFFASPLMVPAEEADEADVTVTLQEAFLPFTVLTVIVAVPLPLAVIFPPDTVTTFLLLEVQVSLFLPA